MSKCSKEETKNTNHSKWFIPTIILIVVIVAVVVVSFITCMYKILDERIESNIQFIKIQGFNAERGYFSSFAPFMRISNVTYFLTLARNWNITTIFVDTGDGEMFFIYEGIIYVHK